MTTRKNITRRTLLKLSLFTATTSCVARAYSATPPQTQGPFYPLKDQADKDLDLTQIKGNPKKAEGTIIQVAGKILDENGAPVADAQVEIWQANARGRYAHERDKNPAPLDPNFQGWGQIQSTTDGAYLFTTILPGAYPAASDWVRPPHIHFKIKKTGFRELTTQMYFPEHPLNGVDQILQALPKNEQTLLIATRVDLQKNHKSSATEGFLFNIILRKL